MAKRSFFEKLTGASLSGEDDTQEESSSVEASKDEKEIKTEKEEIKEKTDASSKASAKEETPSAKNNDELLTESEGQLTIDVYQNENEVVIKSTIAGVEPNGIDINITNDMITIKGNRQKDEEIKEKDYYYQECYWGPFSRSVILPVDVESDSAKASMKNGILTIRLPKTEKIKMKKIEIQPE